MLSDLATVLATEGRSATTPTWTWKYKGMGLERPASTGIRDGKGYIEGRDKLLTPLSGKNDNSAKGTLGACVDECDKDSQCKAGLKCYHRRGYDPVPGCSGRGYYGWDYCYQPIPTMRYIKYMVVPKGFKTNGVAQTLTWKIENRIANVKFAVSVQANGDGGYSDSFYLSVDEGLRRAVQIGRASCRERV